MEKIFISAQELLEDSFTLATEIYESGFQPDLIIGIWRGGTPVAIAIHEYLHYRGIKTAHLAIKTESYTGINEQSEHIEITGMEAVMDSIDHYKSILIVDDVFDTGRSIQAVLKTFSDAAVVIKVACPWFKPTNNKTELAPDFYLHETPAWLVFPHELIGLTPDEILKGKPELADVLNKLKSD